MPTKLLFKTAYGERDRHYISSGSRTEPTYAYEINKYGQKELVKTGETDIYAKIQESLEETKIENILKRYAAGDTSVMRPDGIYEDISQMPKNLIEARQQMQKLENLWEGLSPDTKRNYNFSIDEFIGAAGSDKWLKDMGLIGKENKVELEEVNKQQPTNEGGGEA